MLHPARHTLPGQRPAIPVEQQETDTMFPEKLFGKRIRLFDPILLEGTDGLPIS
jgi:hypothetical protein